MKKHPNNDSHTLDVITREVDGQLERIADMLGVEA